MKRHPALQPFSRDHNVGLVLARRLETASDEDSRHEALEEARSAWDAELKEHFDMEERLLSSLCSPAMAQRLSEEHRTLEELITGTGAERDLATIGRLLHDHIRWEERELFPEIENAASEEQLSHLSRATEALEKQRADSTLAPRRGELMKRREAESPVVDLAGLLQTGRVSNGPAWGCQTDDLNATLLVWQPGQGVAPHVNDDLDVIMVVLQGGAELLVDGVSRSISAGQTAVIPKGAERGVTAGDSGVAYLNVHRRRRGLMPGNLKPRATEGVR